MRRHKKVVSQQENCFSATCFSVCICLYLTRRRLNKGLICPLNPQVAICAQVLNVAFANLIKTVHHKSARLLETCGEKINLVEILSLFDYFFILEQFETFCTKSALFDEKK